MPGRDLSSLKQHCYTVISVICQYDALYKKSKLCIPGSVYAVQYINAKVTIVMNQPPAMPKMCIGGAAEPSVVKNFQVLKIMRPVGSATAKHKIHR